jgi:colicin import membrane protein
MRYFKRITAVLLAYFVLALGAQAQILSSSDIPSDEDRLAESLRLEKKRDEMEAIYEKAMRDCYQRFDVVGCQLKARDKRFQILTVLRKEENKFNAIERQIKAFESLQRTAEKTNDEQLQDAANQRQEAIQAAKDRLERTEQKKKDYLDQGSNRPNYDAKQREAAQHRLDTERRVQERTNTPADPLPSPVRAK